MSRKRIKQYLMLLTAVGLIAVAANGSGTFASFTAVVNNNGNQFSTGTLLLHQTADSGTTCASESNASNNETCQTLFSVDLSGKVASGPLTSTISSGASVTSIGVDSLSQDVESGETVTIGSESFVASADVAASGGSTSIPVLPQTAAATHSSGATVTADPSKPHYITLAFQNAGTLDASDLSVQSGACAETNPNTESVGTITGESGTSSPYTINVSGGLTIALPNGASLSDGTNTYTLSGAAVAGDTSVTVTGGATPPASSGSLLYAPTFGSTSLCDSTVQLAETDSTFGLGTTTACPLTGGGTTANDCADATETLTTLNSDTNPTAEALSLNSGGNGNAGTGIDANGWRYFVLGVIPPSASGNDLQNKKAQFDMTWQLDQAANS
jgi:hypothetical protein